MTADLTPVEHHGGVWVKRDDLFSVAGAPGGKARTCWHLATRDGHPDGLVTAGSRSSPQVNIVARIARELEVPCRVHTPRGVPGPEVAQAVRLGAVRVEQHPGYNTVLIKRAADDAHGRGWTLIPFGMETPAAVTQTAGQVANLPWPRIDRIVVPVGSGMSLAGILTGLRDWTLPRGRPPVLGVVVGADPRRRLRRYAPPGWEDMVDLIDAGVPYDRATPATLDGIELDPIYEAKCLRFLEDRDLLWIVGVRPPATTTRTRSWMPNWPRA